MKITNWFSKKVAINLAVLILELACGKSQWRHSLSSSYFFLIDLKVLNNECLRMIEANYCTC